MVYLYSAQLFVKTKQYSIDDVGEIVSMIGIEEVDCSDKDENTYIGSLESNYEIGSIDELLEMLKPVLDELESANILLKATLFNQERHEYMDVEINSNKGITRYRETNWYINEVIDSDLTYEEYEEEGYNDLTEEDFETYSHGNNDGSRAVNTRSGFNKWINID